MRCQRLCADGQLCWSNTSLIAYLSKVRHLALHVSTALAPKDTVFPLHISTAFVPKDTASPLRVPTAFAPKDTALRPLCLARPGSKGGQEDAAGGPECRDCLGLAERQRQLCAPGPPSPPTPPLVID